MSRSLLRAGIGSFLGSVLSGSIFKKRTWSNGGFEQGYSNTGKKLKRLRSSASSGSSVGQSQIISTQSQIMPKRRGTSLRALVYRAGKGKGLKKSKRSFVGKRKVRNSVRSKLSKFEYRVVKQMSSTQTNPVGVCAISVYTPWTTLENTELFANQRLLRQADAYASASNYQNFKLTDVSQLEYGNIMTTNFVSAALMEIPKLPIKKASVTMRLVSLSEARQVAMIDVFSAKYALSKVAIDGIFTDVSDISDNNYQLVGDAYRANPDLEIDNHDPLFRYSDSATVNNRYFKHLKSIHVSLDPGQIKVISLPSVKRVLNAVTELHISRNLGFTTPSTTTDIFGHVIGLTGVQKGDYVYVCRNYGQLLKTTFNSAINGKQLAYCPAEIGFEMRASRVVGFPLCRHPLAGKRTSVFSNQTYSMSKDIEGPFINDEQDMIDTAVNNV